ncbi:MAG: hypothetical protein IJ621_05500 [Paludibacteraceae bacterium]|nr:hypothetical protein [Paludibacteraceae bacterium]
MKLKQILFAIWFLSYIGADYVSAAISSSYITERVRQYYSELSLFAQYGDKDEGRIHRERIKNELLVDGLGLIFNDIEYSLNNRNQPDTRFDSYIISIFGNKVVSFMPQNIQTSLQGDDHWRATYLLTVSDKYQKRYDIELEMLFNTDGKILTIQRKQQKRFKLNTCDVYFFPYTDRIENASNKVFYNGKGNLLIAIRYEANFLPDIAVSVRKDGTFYPAKIVKDKHSNEVYASGIFPKDRLFDNGIYELRVVEKTTNRTLYEGKFEIKQPKESEFKITRVYVSKVGKDGSVLSKYEKKFYGLRVEIYYTRLSAPKQISLDFKHDKNGKSGYTNENTKIELPVGTLYSFVLDNYGQQMRNEGKYIFDFYDIVNNKRSNNKLYSETYIPIK